MNVREIISAMKEQAKSMPPTQQSWVDNGRDEPLVGCSFVNGAYKWRFIYDAEGRNRKAVSEKEAEEVLSRIATEDDLRRLTEKST